jgi:hypothetical protein
LGPASWIFGERLRGARAPASGRDIDAQWKDCAVERQDRDRQMSRRLEIKLGYLQKSAGLCNKGKKSDLALQKAIGFPEGMAELSVFYCEQVTIFLGDCGMEDEGYFSALVLMFEQALKWVTALPENQQKPPS